MSLRNSGNGGIIRFDHTQTNPIVETLITGLSEPVYDIAIYGNNLYMTIQSVGMIFKIDITQTNPVLEDVIAAQGVNDVVVEGDFLYYCSNYISRINLLDATPVAESIISGITSAWDLLFDGDDLFIARQVMGKIEKLNSAFVDPTLSPDYAALVSFYNSTDGLNWTNSTNWFDPAKSLYSWHGVVSNENNKIVGINLAGNNLSGTLSTEIGDFDQLKILRISGNMPTGDLPSSLSDLTNLETLWLGGNNFTGTISPSIANLSNLSYLYIQNNEFTGTIPSEFGGLTPFTVLHLYDNNFEGILPSSLSNLTNLTSIAISDNNFEGTIPFNAPNANINVTNNYFDFSDLEPLDQANNYISLNYSPQRTRDLAENIESGVGVDITLNVNDTNIDRDGNETAMNNIYQWYKDDVAITGSNSANYTITNAHISDSGDYFCEITNNILPALTIVRAPITVLKDPSLSVIDTEIDNELSIYPNPTKNWLNIKSDALTDAKLSIYDINGRLVITQNLEGNLNALNVEQLQSGTYILKIEDHNKVQTQRFIKQ